MNLFVWPSSNVIKSQSFSDFIVTSKYKLTILPIILIVNHTHQRKRHLVEEIHTNSSNQSECASQLDANLCLEQRKKLPSRTAVTLVMFVP